MVAEEDALHLVFFKILQKRLRQQYREQVLLLQSDNLIQAAVPAIVRMPSVKHFSFHDDSRGLPIPFPEPLIPRGKEDPQGLITRLIREAFDSRNDISGYTNENAYKLINSLLEAGLKAVGSADKIDLMLHTAGETIWSRL
jgi:hypothetical protein